MYINKIILAQFLKTGTVIRITVYQLQPPTPGPLVPNGTKGPGTV